MNTLWKCAYEPGLSNVSYKELNIRIVFKAPGSISQQKMLKNYPKRKTSWDNVSLEIVFQTEVIDGLSEIPTRIYDLAAPDHYHYMEGEKNLYIGHLFKGFVQVLNRRTGREVKKIGVEIIDTRLG